MKKVKYVSLIFLVSILGMGFQSSSFACPEPEYDECGNQKTYMQAVSEPGIAMMALSLGYASDFSKMGDVTIREDDRDITKLSLPESVMAHVPEKTYKKYSKKGL